LKGEKMKIQRRQPIDYIRKGMCPKCKKKSLEYGTMSLDDETHILTVIYYCSNGAYCGVGFEQEYKVKLVNSKQISDNRDTDPYS